MSKLTVTHDLQFRGTLQRFLAQIMPLTHMTGVNLNGKLNDTNTTSIETQSDLRAAEPQLALNSSEFKAYRNFWSIQKYLNNPIMIFKSDTSLEFEDMDSDLLLDHKSEESFAEGQPSPS